MTCPPPETAVSKALGEYCADLKSTLSPSAFIRWAKTHRAELVAEIGPDTLEEDAYRLIGAGRR